VIFLNILLTHTLFVTSAEDFASVLTQEQPAQPGYDWLSSIPEVDNRASYKERMRQKNIQEDHIWGRIESVTPLNINIADTKMDRAGVDAWFDSTKDGQRVPRTNIQLKMRTRDDTVLMEAIKPWPPVSYAGLEQWPPSEEIWTGRDLKAGRFPIDQYYSIDTQGKLRILDADTIKTEAKALVLKFLNALRRNPRERGYEDETGRVAITRDPSAESTFTQKGDVGKILVYLNPQKLTPIDTVDLTQAPVPSGEFDPGPYELTALNWYTRYKVSQNFFA